MTPVVPHELTDRIIDFLHNDYVTLSAVSLACRSFLPATRFHRFAHLVLVGGRIEGFNKLLDISPDLGPFVGELVLDSGLSNASWRRLTAKTVSAMLDRLPSINSLGFRYLKLDKEIMRTVTNVRRLRTLSLVACILPSPDSLARTLSTLEHLTHLNVEDLSHAEDDAITGGVQPPRILTFGATGMDTEGTSQICSWILNGEDSGDIRTLYTKVRSRAEASAMRDLIETLGDTLTDFQMVVDAEASLAAVFGESDLSLRCLTNLRSCRLTFKLREMFVPENISLPWITGLVSQLSSNRLSEVSLSIHADDVRDLRSLDSECGVRETFPVSFDELQALDWTALDESLNTERLGSLQQIVISGVGDPSALQAFLRMNHPLLESLVDLVHT
ncbi:hypothetical protein EIP86_000621 [Pleurotus ostreatoroseus]|nr:hypothetical protein EIP86_000621 [Pleurotus ostreatoroseus]